MTRVVRLLTIKLDEASMSKHRHPQFVRFKITRRRNFTFGERWLQQGLINHIYRTITRPMHRNSAKNSTLGRLIVGVIVSYSKRKRIFLFKKQQLPEQVPATECWYLLEARALEG